MCAAETFGERPSWWAQAHHPRLAAPASATPVHPYPFGHSDEISIVLDVIFIGLSLGSILLLVALGLAITYGAMGVINMAHGEMVMLGAYVTVLSGIWLGTNIFVAIPLAFIVTALLGLLIERVVVRRLYGRLLDTLLATWGIAILIQQAVRLEFGLSFFGIHIQGLGPGLQNVSVPPFLQGTFMIGGAEINRYRAFIIVVTAILTAATWPIMYRTF